VTLLDQWRRQAFVWGQTDCIMATCNYIRDTTGIDPGAPWRGSYDTEEGAQAIYQAFGGVLGLCRHAMAQAGFRPAQAAPGLPVVCDVMGVEVAGVSLGNRVAFMAQGRGVVEMRAKVLDAWHI
jgi:hypothetical protein